MPIFSTFTCVFILVLVFSFHTTIEAVDELKFTNFSCPSSCICAKNNENPSRNLSCRLNDLQMFAPNFLDERTEILTIEKCERYIDDFALESFSTLSSNLYFLQIRNCGLKNIYIDYENSNDTSDADWKFKNLRILDLSENRLEIMQFEIMANRCLTINELILRGNRLADADFQFFANIRFLDISKNRFSAAPKIPAQLTHLNLSNNPIRKLFSDDFFNNTRLETLDLSYCRISILENDTFSSLFSLRKLFLQGNPIGRLQSDIFVSLSSMQILDLSACRLTNFDSQNLLRYSNNLTYLNLAKNPLNRMDKFSENLINLSTLDAAESEMLYFDLLSVASLTNLSTLILRDNRKMLVLLGHMQSHAPVLRTLDIRDCALKQLPFEFFENVTQLQHLYITGNPWVCGCPLAQWITVYESPIFVDISRENLTSKICANASFFYSILCADLGVGVPGKTVITTLHGSEAVLDCLVYGSRVFSVRWERVVPEQHLGLWQPDKSEPFVNGKYTILPGGLLRVHMVDRYDVAPYKCAAFDDKNNASALLFLRLDFSNWWEMKLYSFVCGMITAIGFFALNCVYAAIRRIIMWRISKLEQTSRVRLLLGAMEKYRQRQMESLHDKYSTKMNQIRDNYHVQMVQMRRSYCAQSERFRDYRVAQMESVSHHIDNIKDNYYWQTSRMREYGSRQMERLWESYQRQVNRVRAFSLQQRLRLMRQYKIKQRYWNTFFESVNMETADRLRDASCSVAIPPEMIELPQIASPDLVDEAEDGLVRILERLASESECDELDGSSYHSFPPTDIESVDGEFNDTVEKTVGRNCATKK